MVPTDPPEVASLQWAGISGTSAFDVGAHLGENIPFLRAAGCGRIIALEPFPELYKQIAGRWPDVWCYQLAAWDREGMLELRENDGMLGVLMGTVTHEVPCITLDQVAAIQGCPDIVVVDVEGGEQKVLGGSPEILSAGKTSWLIEFHTAELYDACREVLERHGYDAKVIRHPHYAPGSPLWHGHGWIKALRFSPDRAREPSSW